MMRSPRALPDFALEVHLGRWEFAARFNLTASDAETFTIDELLAFGDSHEREAFLKLPLSYLPTRGTDALREAIAATYESIAPKHVLAFAGAEEAMFWALSCLLEPGDHAVVTVPNYQAMESVPIAAGASVDAMPLWEGSGSSLRWAFDVNRLLRRLKPSTKLVCVNFPNNPTGFIPDASTWAEIVALCDARGIRLFSDEVYRGLELDPARMLRQAADMSKTAISLNVVSKAYGLPGLRVGWIATHDERVLDRLERAKHYTTICNAGPSEFLAAIALRHGEELRARNREIIRANAPAIDSFMRDHAALFEYAAPRGGCVAFPRYLGSNGVEAFCQRAVEEWGVVLLPASVYRSTLVEVPRDRFRIGIGRRNVPEALAELRQGLAR